MTIPYTRVGGVEAGVSLFLREIFLFEIVNMRTCLWLIAWFLLNSVTIPLFDALIIFLLICRRLSWQFGFFTCTSVITEFNFPLPLRAGSLGFPSKDDVCEFWLVNQIVEACCFGFFLFLAAVPFLIW
jgi:hypothetical protein